VNNTFVKSAVCCALLAFGPTAAVAGPELSLPDFGHLKSRAVDSVDMTLDGFLMRLAAKFASEASQDPGHDAALAALKDIKSVRVRNFEFDTDGAYSMADIDAVRRQLAEPGWTAVVQARKREEREDVDVYLNMEGEKILGIALIASDPRSFTIVNVVGSIDIDSIATLERELGLPKLGMND
jgi:hypothetical protein